MKRKKVLIFSVFCGLFFVLGWFWWAWAASSSCFGDCQTKVFVVRKGEGLGLVAQRLEEEKLIRSSLAFQILATRLGLTRKIQAGDFRLSPGMSPEEIVQQLTHGTLDLWATLIEGRRREEIAEQLTKSGLEDFDQTEFLKLTQNLEGQLFPDTYLFPKEADAQRIVSLLAANFKKKTSSLGADKQTLILASIVEREAKYEVDRPVVAGIILKRLNEGWPLQVDATIQYAVGTQRCQGRNECEWWPKRLTKEDLAIKSPYNSYLSVGLPPSPICNPGLASIKATLNSQKTDYWYYLSDSQGRMHYAKTFEEHRQNIVQYLR